MHPIEDPEQVPNEVLVACPECGIRGTHLGTCKWSFMQTGRAWIIVAKVVEMKNDLNE